jgi:DNA-binding XRE family transcriptional regulator
VRGRASQDRAIQGSQPRIPAISGLPDFARTAVPGQATLSRSGPALGRPLVDTITNSKVANLKELRPGSPRTEERRRKTLMARQSGQRLAEERKQRGLTQAQLAETMGVTPGRVSQIERGELSTIEAIARYVQALGGRLDLVANFTDHTLTVTSTEAA